MGGADQRGNMVSGYELITGTTDEEVDVFGELPRGGGGRGRARSGRCAGWGFFIAVE